ncbi:amino acid adenylation domain-containing protein [Streptomyces sp. NPDC002055]|uniref:amino acid adenylation domain-containing protein n=1 Tax=Streptomyces sp. NPDC002055 TaxID=3154534 RepID=UPI003321069B
MSDSNAPRAARRRGPATLHGAVARQALLRPDAIALVHGEKRVGYAELDAAADSFAAVLQDLGVRPGHRVPVLLPRSPELVAVLLAVLKCGAAYAAVDHRWPVERVRSVLRTLDTPVLVADPTDTALAVPAWAPPPGGLPAAVAAGGAPRPTDVDGAAPAMVFFTSGTTGTPKGVLSPHRATLRLFSGPTFADFGPGRVMPQAAPVPWDAFGLELWGMLTTGGCSVIVDRDQLFPDDLRDLVKSAAVDTLWLTASLFNLFVDEDLDSFTGVRQVMTGGERLSVPHVRAFLQRFPQTALLNGYGPVESCVFVTTRAVRPADCGLPGGIPVGRPVPGTAVHLLHGTASVPADEQGEICVAGDGLALGYLGDPAATAERFVTVRFDGVPTRLYRTGDLGRLDEAGVLHFVGRADRQVKISGYRVEPAEIEATALTLPGVRECAVVPVPGPDGTVDRLALFYTADAEAEEPGRIRDALAARLPHYMVPPTVRRTAGLPRTANGKLDRAALCDRLGATASNPTTGE